MRRVEMSLVDRVVVVYQEPQFIGRVFVPEVFTGGHILHRRDALHENNVIPVVSPDLVSTPLHQPLALPHRFVHVGKLRDHRLVYQPVALYRRLVGVSSRYLAPELHKSALILRVCPERRAVPLGLVAALRIVHVQHQTDVVFLSPGNAPVDVIEALLLVDIRVFVVLKPAVVQQEPHRIESQLRHLPEAVLVMMKPDIR